MNQSRIRITYFHHGGAEGGAPLSLKYLVASLEQDKYDIIVVNAGDEQSPGVNAMFEQLGIKTLNCQLPRFAHTTGGHYNLLKLSGWQKLLRWYRGYSSAKKRLERLIADVKPDIVHFNSLTLAPYASVPHASGIPTVVHVRESVLKGAFGFRTSWLRKHLIMHASRVIAICRDNLDRLGLPAGKGVVIYNPVPFAKFDFQLSQDAARLKLGVPMDAKVVLMTMTATSTGKGAVPFIKAMQQVIKTNNELWCLIPGLTIPATPHPPINSIRRIVAFALGRYRNQTLLYALANNGGLQGRIICCDFAADMEQWIAAADIVCVPYTQPHFSRTLLEAGAMKKPVIASRVGGLEECVQEGETGLLAPAGDAQALALAVERLLRNEQERKRMGGNNYQFVISKADAALSAQCVMKVYDDLLA